MKEPLRRDPHSVTARILDAAQAEFMRAGYERASTNRMAREFGVSKATIFRYYPTKVDLFEAVLRRIADSWHARIGWENIAATEPRAWLREFGFSALVSLLEEDALFVGRTAVIEGRLNAEIQRAWPRIATATILETLVSRFNTWSEAGQIYAPDPKRLAWAFLDLTQSGEVARALYGSRITETSQDLRDHIDFSVDLFLRGCSARTSDDKAETPSG